MALGAPSESPAVVVKEIDLTGGVPNVQSTTGAIVGNFRWGPVDQRTKIANETELADTFATPDETNTIDYHSASYFLRYSSNMQVVRAVTSAATNAFSTTKASLTTGGEVIDGDLNTGGTSLTLTNTKYSADSQNTLRIAEASTNHQNQTVLIKNFDNWEEQASNLGDITQTQALGTDSDGGGNLLLDSDAGIGGNITFAARYPGALGNSLAVSICARAADFDGWDYEDDFDGAPGTSSYVETNPGTAANDEIHVVVVDDKGTITGTKGTVLETYPFLSKVKGATNADGTNNYALDVINQRSSYVHMAQWDSDQKNIWCW